MTIQAEQYRGSDGNIYRMWRTDLNDHTPTFLKYDSKCSHCWYGHAHSEAAHNEKIQKSKD